MLSGEARVVGGALRLTDDWLLSPDLNASFDGGATVGVALPRAPLEHLSLALDLRIAGLHAPLAEAATPHGLTVSFGAPALPLALAAARAPNHTAAAAAQLAAVGWAVEAAPPPAWAWRWSRPWRWWQPGGGPVVGGLVKWEENGVVDEAGARASSWVAAAEVEATAEAAVAASGAAGLRLLFGYGATRDAGATNTSVWTYLRVRHDAPAAAAAVDETLWLEEHTYRDEARPLELASYGWRPALVAVEDARLSVWLDGALLVDALPLPGWAPTAAWRVGLHGSRDPNEPWVTQWVDNVQLASGALRSEAHVPVAVARNGQQFDVSTKNRSYGYQAPTVVSAVAPRAAHAATPAAVVVRGANLFGGALACVGHACSSGYRCRFGNVTVDAARNASDGSLRCVAPPQPDADGPLPLAVSLNGGDDFGAPIPFDYLGAAVASCTPAAVAATRRGGARALAAAEAPTAAALCSGPTAGGARVVLRGAALHRGHDRECRLRRRRRGAGVARRGRRRRVRRAAGSAQRHGERHRPARALAQRAGCRGGDDGQLHLLGAAGAALDLAARRAGRRAHRRHDPRRRLRRRRRAAAVPLRRGRRRRRTERVRRHARVRRAARRRRARRHRRGGSGL